MEKIEEEEKSPAPGGIRTHNLLIMRHVPLFYNHSPRDKDLVSLTFGARLAWNVGGTNDPFGRSDKGEARGDSPG